MYIIIQISFTLTATHNTHGGPQPAGSVPGAGNHIVLPFTHGQTRLALLLVKTSSLFMTTCVLPCIHSAIADSPYSIPGTMT